MFDKIKEFYKDLLNLWARARGGRAHHNKNPLYSIRGRIAVGVIILILYSLVFILLKAFVL